MPTNPTDNESALIQVMAWRGHATRHYLIQCWQRSKWTNGVIRPRWGQLLTGHTTGLYKYKMYYNDVIMNAMASQITSVTIVYSTVYSRRRSKKMSKLRVIGLCERNSPVTGEFPAQRAMFQFDYVIMYQQEWEIQSGFEMIGCLHNIYLGTLSQNDIRIQLIGLQQNDTLLTCGFPESLISMGLVCISVYFHIVVRDCLQNILNKLMMLTMWVDAFNFQNIFLTVD